MLRRAGFTYANFCPNPVIQERASTEKNDTLLTDGEIADDPGPNGGYDELSDCYCIVIRCLLRHVTIPTEASPWESLISPERSFLCLSG